MDYAGEPSVAGVDLIRDSIEPNLKEPPQDINIALTNEIGPQAPGLMKFGGGFENLDGVQNPQDALSSPLRASPDYLSTWQPRSGNTSEQNLLHDFEAATTVTSRSAKVLPRLKVASDDQSREASEGCMSISPTSTTYNSSRTTNTSNDMPPSHPNTHIDSPEVLEEAPILQHLNREPYIFIATYFVPALASTIPHLKKLLGSFDWTALGLSKDGYYIIFPDSRRGRQDASRCYKQYHMTKLLSLYTMDMECQLHGVPKQGGVVIAEKGFRLQHNAKTSDPHNATVPKAVDIAIQRPIDSLPEGCEEPINPDPKTLYPVKDGGKQSCLSEHSLPSSHIETVFIQPKNEVIQAKPSGIEERGKETHRSVSEADQIENETSKNLFPTCQICAKRVFNTTVW